MKENLVYLKPNVVIEPLVANWYAWSHLISPATAALNTTDRHVPIMDSYVSSPEIHMEAVKDARMRGGPFMEFRELRIDDVKALRQEANFRQKTMFEFSTAIKALDKILSNANGASMEELYPNVPEALKGYVELFYDRNNRAGFRLFESLLYTSEFYLENLQSIALWMTNNDERPFCLSTPRLKERHVIQLNIPFRDDRIDELAAMKMTPKSLDWITDRLRIRDEDKSSFGTFFTEVVPKDYSAYSGNLIRMRYFGHACILIETNDLSILVDPLISYYGYHSDVEHFSMADLPTTIDYVLITHNHQDHILFETLLSLRHKIGRIIVPAGGGGRLEDPDLRLMFKSIGFDNVFEISEMASIRFSNMEITGMPFTGEHGDLNILTKMCYHVKIGDFKIAFFADSRVVEPKLYQIIQRRLGNIDVAFIGMECDGAPMSWLYGPLVNGLKREHDKQRRLSGSDCSRGMSIIDIFRPKEVYVYAMGQEPWVEFISSIKYTDESNPIVQSNRLLEVCKARGITAERLFGEKEILYNC